MIIVIALFKVWLVFKLITWYLENETAKIAHVLDLESRVEELEDK